MSLRCLKGNVDKKILTSVKSSLLHLGFAEWNKMGTNKYIQNPLKTRSPFSRHLYNDLCHYSILIQVNIFIKCLIENAPRALFIYYINIFPWFPLDISCIDIDFT